MTHPAALADDALWAQCHMGKSRGSGPGGQHRNKVETLVTITHDPTGIGAHAGENRSATENKSLAFTRLRLALAVQVRMPVPLGDARSELWVSRTNGGKIVCSTKHRDYPTLLAEALDMISACRYDAKKAAIRLDVTTTQLVRFVAEHAPALVWWNARREELGLHGLKGE